MIRERLVVAGLFGIPVLAASAMVAWSAGKPVSAQTTDSFAKLAPIKGLVEPSDTVDLASSEKGIVQELTVEEGDSVKAGQVICRLESGVEEAALKTSQLQAESDDDIRVALFRHELAQIEYKRLQKLEQREAAGPMELDEARINEKYTGALVDKARQDKRIAQFRYQSDQKVIARRTIKSPMDGYVARKAKSVGELVDGVDDTVICNIVKLDPLHVLVAPLAETYGKIKRGDRARIEGDQLPGGKAEAKVILVDRLVAADSQTYTIKLELPNPGSRIPAGIKVMVTFP